MNEARRLLEKVTACLPHIQGRVLDEVRHYLSKPEESCEWTEDEWDGAWHTNCGGCFCFEYNFRDENKSYKFCPTCGKPIKVIPFKAPVEEPNPDPEV